MSRQLIQSRGREAVLAGVVFILLLIFAYYEREMLVPVLIGAICILAIFLFTFIEWFLLRKKELDYRKGYLQRMRKNRKN